MGSKEILSEYDKGTALLCYLSDYSIESICTTIYGVVTKGNRQCIVNYLKSAIDVLDRRNDLT